MAVIMGIDPGAKTGIALYSSGVLLSLKTLPPYHLERELTALQPSRVVFEDSRLQSHTWTKAASRAAAAKMARNVGEIDAWCKLIVGVCESLGIPAHSISPAQKGAKLSAKQFESVTGWLKPSNEHERDAAMVAWRYRNAKGSGHD